MTKNTTDELREGLCQVCGNDYPTPWYAPNENWNKFMRHPDGREASEKYGFVCPNCFIATAQKLGYKHAWVVLTDEMLEALISNREKLARIDELERTMPHTDGMRHYNTVKARIATLRKELEWGASYIVDRYGSPSNALGFWYSQCGSDAGCWY